MLCMVFVAVWCHAAMPWGWFSYRIGGTTAALLYMVGFSNSSYFSRCFSQQFGCTPGNYKSKK